MRTRRWKRRALTRLSSATSDRTRTPTCSRPANVLPQATRIDSIIGLGGGSSLDCAKGINFLLTQGGRDPRLSGLRQSGETHAADDRGANHGGHRQRSAIVRHHFGPADTSENGVRRPEGSVPRRHPRSMSHADATCVGHGGRGVQRHRACCGELRLNETNCAVAGESARSVAVARGQLRARARSARRSRSPGPQCSGAFYAGAAIELSMLGATHACANPVTRGTAPRMATPSPSCCRTSSAGTRAVAETMYTKLIRSSSTATAPHRALRPSQPIAPSSTALAARLAALAGGGDLPTTLRQAGVSADDRLCSRIRRPNSGPVNSIPVRSMPGAPWRFINARCNSLVPYARNIRLGSQSCPLCAGP